MNTIRNILLAALTVIVAAGCSQERKTISPQTESAAANASEANLNAPPPPSTNPGSAPGSTSGVRVPVEERSTPQGFVSETGTAATTARSHGATPTHPTKALGIATVALAPMGEDPGESILDGIEDPNRVKDLEADALRTGKRVVGPISEDLGGGYDSAEDLARAILTAVRANDTKALHSLRVSNREFARIFWPEFPQSRPATNVQADDAWFFHDASCHDGVSEIVSEFGGRDLELFEVQCKKGRLDYTNFDLYDDIVIEAVDSRGERISIPWATTFAERHGKWKVFLYKA
jgi:hypothetical protein